MSLVEDALSVELAIQNQVYIPRRMCCRKTQVLELGEGGGEGETQQARNLTELANQIQGKCLHSRCSQLLVQQATSILFIPQLNKLHSLHSTGPLLLTT